MPATAHTLFANRADGPHRLWDANSYDRLVQSMSPSGRLPTIHLELTSPPTFTGEQGGDWFYRFTRDPGPRPAYRTDRNPRWIGVMNPRLADAPYLLIVNAQPQDALVVMDWLVNDWSRARGERCSKPARPPAGASKPAGGW